MTYPIGCDIVPPYSVTVTLSAAYNTMKKLVFTLTATFLASIAIASPVSAGSTNSYTNPCAPYGAGECYPVSIVVNKTVQNPQTKAFVDNLTIADSMYSPDNTVVYRIDVKNPNTATLNNIIVKDTLPTNFVNFVQATDQTYDPSTKIISIPMFSLNAGETKTFTITGKIAPDNTFSETTCNIINTVTVTTNGASDSDSASICVKKANIVYPTSTIKTTPKTGPEMLSLIGLLPGGLAGIALRRKSYNKH